MKELVRFIVSPIVENPDAIEITEVDSEKGKTLQLRVAQSDLGRVIGKQGKTAKAIRTILLAASAKSEVRYGLDIIEE